MEVCQQQIVLAAVPITSDPTDAVDEAMGR